MTKCREGFTPIRMFTILRAQRMGWALGRGPLGLQLRSPRNTIYLVRLYPLSARRYNDHRLPDAA